MDTLIHRYYLYSGEKNKIEDYHLSSFFEYCVFNDGILYLGVKGFEFDDSILDEEKSPDENLSESELRNRITWRCWFDNVQKLHNSNLLKGIIIDLRNNGGGRVNNYQYVIGALQESDLDSSEKGWGKMKVLGSIRQKNGVGRFDYSPFVPHYVPIYNKEHAIINEPVVVLTNCWTGSMAEISCLGAKELGNSCLIGTRTSGLFGPLIDDNGKDHYTRIWSGSVGDSKEEPFYIRMPYCAFISLNGEFLEGEGIKPDIAVQLDTSLYDNTGRDNQLERALEYIRTGK